MKTTTKASKRTPKAPIFAPSIVAIDLGKFKSVACAYDPERRKGTQLFYRLKAMPQRTSV